MFGVVGNTSLLTLAKHYSINGLSSDVDSTLKLRLRINGGFWVAGSMTCRLLRWANEQNDVRSTSVVNNNASKIKTLIQQMNVIWAKLFICVTQLCTHSNHSRIWDVNYLSKTDHAALFPPAQHSKGNRKSTKGECLPTFGSLHESFILIFCFTEMWAYFGL